MKGYANIPISEIFCCRNRRHRVQLRPCWVTFLPNSVAHLDENCHCHLPLPLYDPATILLVLRIQVQGFFYWLGAQLLDHVSRVAGFRSQWIVVSQDKPRRLTELILPLFRLLWQVPKWPRCFEFGHERRYNKQCHRTHTMKLVDALLI